MSTQEAEIIDMGAPQETGLWGGSARKGESAHTGSSAKRERLEQYLQWMLTPEAERQPRTKKELAKQLGVSPQTLDNYSRDRTFQKKYATELARLRRVEKAPKVLQKLYERAMQLDPMTNASAANTAAKIWLQFTLDANLDEDRGGEVNAQEMSDEELMESAVRILNRFAGKS